MASYREHDVPGSGTQAAFEYESRVMNFWKSSELRQQKCLSIPYWHTLPLQPARQSYGALGSTYMPIYNLKVSTFRSPKISEILESRIGGPLHPVEECVVSNLPPEPRGDQLTRLTVANSMDELMESVHLPAGMQLYSFMFEESDPAVLAGYVADGKLPAPATLLLGFGVGSILTVLRVLLDHVLYEPLARRILGLSQRQQVQTPVAGLDALCSTSKKPSADEVAKAAAVAGVSTEKALEYVSTKRQAAEEKRINKFKEAAWRLTVYSSLVMYALKLCYGVVWFNDPFLVWEDWPTAARSDDLELFYHCSMGVYWHLIIFQFCETRRSDFIQMLVHHLATLFLLSYSWLMSLARIGTLIMLCHDVSDIFMETAKLFNYAQKRYPWCHLAADGFFFAFAAVFGFSRLYIFPKYMILSVWYTGTLSQTQRLFFCFLLCTLLALHTFWFYLILRMIYMFVAHGVEEDIRETEDAAASNGHKSNGHGQSSHQDKHKKA